MDITQPLAIVISAAVTALGGWAVMRASKRSDQRTAERTVAAEITSKRIQAEDDAYEKAEAQLGRTIDRLQAEVAELEGDVRGARARVAQLEQQLEAEQLDHGQTRRQLDETRTLLANREHQLLEKSRDLEAARVLLQQRFPDEP